MWSTSRCCRLYSWMRFTCTSKSDSGATVMPVRSAMSAARRALVSELHVAPLLLELRVVRERFELAEPAQVAAASRRRRAR